MTTVRRCCDAAYAIAIAVWLGAVVMAGVVAAIVFPTTRALDPRLPEYAAYSGEHWRIVAGQVAARVFSAADMIQYVCAGAVALGIAGLWLVRGTRPALATRTLLAVAAIGLLGYHGLILTPRMHPNMTGYWAAARAGDTAAAERMHEAFSRDHPTATRVLVATAVTLLLSLGVSAWSLSGREGMTRAEPTR